VPGQEAGLILPLKDQVGLSNVSSGNLLVL